MHDGAQRGAIRVVIAGARSTRSAERAQLFRRESRRRREDKQRLTGMENSNRIKSVPNSQYQSHAG